MSELTSTEIYDWTNARDRKMSTRARYSVWRVLREVAVPIGRASTRGQPWIWRVPEPFPPRQIEIIDEIGMWPILPILQPMFAPRKGVDIGAAGGRA